MRVGYKTSLAHTHANAVKTNAPATAFWDLLRSFCTTPSRHLPQDGAARRLLAVTPMTTYDMTTIEKRREKKPTTTICEKPHKNWGLGSRKRPGLTTTPAAADDVPLDPD